MHKAFLLVSLFILLPGQALAQVEELENPGSVSAVQERAVRMQHELDLTVGVLPLDAFYKGLFAQVGYVYHFTDTFAWQVGRGGYSYTALTPLRTQLERDFGVLPTTLQPVTFFVGSDLMWTPLYGKLAVLNRWVLHGEVYLLGGATIFGFANASFPLRPGINLGLGARLFVNRWVSFRLEMTDNVVVPVAGAGLLNVMTTSLGLALNFGATE